MAVFERTFHSDLALTGFHSMGLSLGWTHGYDISAQGPTQTGTWGPLTLMYANGGRETLTPVLDGSGNPTGVLTPPTGAPYFVRGVASPTTGQWQSLTVTWDSGSRWQLTPLNGFYALTQITNRTGQSLNLNWDNNRRLTSVTDAASGTILLALTYDANGQLSTVADCYNRQVNYTFGTDPATGLSVLSAVSQIAAAGVTNAPVRASYAYVANTTNNWPLLNQVTVPSPTGQGVSTSTVSYDSNGKVTAFTDPNGNQHVYTYSSGQTQVQVQNAAGVVCATWTKKYDGQGRITGTVDGAGHSDQLVYGDAANPYKPTQYTDKNGHTVNSTYDAYGHLTTFTNARNVTTTFTWDYSAFSLGRLKKAQVGTNQQTPRTATTLTYYEPSGLINTVTAAAPNSSAGGATVTRAYTYDPLGNVLTANGPGNNATVVNGIDQGITTTFAYDSDPGDSAHGVPAYSQTPSVGEPLTITDNLGHVTHIRYTSRGRVLSVFDALGHESDMGDATSAHANGYNLADQPLLVTLPATGQTGGGRGTRTRIYLYPGGPLMSMAATDESGAIIRQVSDSYGADGELKQVAGSTEPAGYTYDALYRLSTLTDGNGHTTSYFYNAAGYLSQMAYPGAFAAAMLPAGSPDTVTFPPYDADGNLLQRVDGNGVITNYVYNDPESLLTDIQYPAGGAGNVHFHNDAYGRRDSMTDGTGGQTYAYDDANDLTAKTVTYTGLPAKTLAYAFWPDGSRQSMTTPAGSFSYTDDGDGRTSSLTSPFAEVSHWQYADNGWLNAQSLGNGVTTTYTHNPLGQITDLLNQTGAGATLSEFSGMVYDGAGNRTTLSANLPGAPSLSGTTSYQYDYGQTADPTLNQGQLTQESTTRFGGSYPFVYGYDPAGNLTSMWAVPNPGYNFDNQTTTPAGPNPASLSDGNGNPGAARGRALSFDPENRLTGAADQATGVSTAAGVGPDNLLRLLANNSTGSISLLNVRLSDGGINQVFSPYGPFADWTAVTTAVGPDNIPHILFNRADGMASIGTIDGSGNYSSLGFGPFPNWTATAMAVGPDNYLYLVWKYAPQNVFVYYRINPADGSYTQLPSPSTFYTLPAGWSVTGITVDTTNHVHLLLTNVNGQFAHWSDTAPGPPPGSLVYTPSFGFLATGIAAGPPADPRIRLLFARADGVAQTWVVTSDTNIGVSPVFGPYAGLTPVNLSMDGYGVGRLLWSKNTGDNLLLNILPDNSSTSTLFTMTASHLTRTGLTNGYDGDGLRAWKQNDTGARKYYLYDGTDPVCVLNGSGNLLYANTFGPNGLLSQRYAASNSTVFYTFDERGNVAQRTSAAGGVQGSDLYDGWGNKRNGTPSDPWGFGGQFGDYTDAETGLVLMTHRFYDPQTGRFTTRDPLGYAGGLNLYAYAGNNPVNRIDPSGLCPGSDDGGGPISDADVHPGMHGGTSQSSLANSMLNDLTHETLPGIGPGYQLADSVSGHNGITGQNYDIPGRFALAGAAAVTVATYFGGVGDEGIQPGADLSELMGGSGLKPTQLDVHAGNVNEYAQSMANGTWDWNRTATDPIGIMVQDSERNILAGHHRFIAAQQAGVTIPDGVVRVLSRPTAGRPVYNWGDVSVLEGFRPPRRMGF